MLVGEVDNEAADLITGIVAIGVSGIVGGRIGGVILFGGGLLLLLLLLSMQLFVVVELLFVTGKGKYHTGTVSIWWGVHGYSDCVLLLLLLIQLP